MSLKRFILKVLGTVLIFSTVFVIGSSLIVRYYPKVSSILFFKHDWLRINERVQSSKNQILQDTLYVGCSVAGQILPYNGENQLTTNGSAYPIGNYFLIKNVIESSENVSCVIYYSVPDVLSHKISRERTHNYFIRPFYTLENKEEIMSSKKVKEVLTKNELLDLNLIDAFKILPINDFNYDDGKKQSAYSLSDESFEWIFKIDSLCKTRGVKFHIASPPVPLSKKIASENWKKIKDKVNGSDLEPLFINYFNTIIYLEDKYLKDHIHWKDSIIKEEKQQYLNFIKKQLL